MDEQSIAAGLALAQEASFQAGRRDPEETTAELAARGCAFADTLVPGSRFYEPGRVLDGDLDGFMVIEQVPCTVLRGPEPARDFFGRAGHFRFWVRDELTGREGWKSYGPGGVARVEPMLPWAPAVADAGREAS